MPVNYPRRDSDDCFRLEVPLQVRTEDPEALAERTNAWLSEWVDANRYWSFPHPKSTNGVLDFSRDFTGTPTCVMRGQGRLGLCIECGPEAENSWKDWLVLRILKDLVSQFKEVTPFGSG
jgi:hypothetical protein